MYRKANNFMFATEKPDRDFRERYDYCCQVATNTTQTFD